MIHSMIYYAFWLYVLVLFTSCVFFCFLKCLLLVCVTCLFVTNFTGKVLNRFALNFQGRLEMRQKIDFGGYVDHLTPLSTYFLRIPYWLIERAPRNIFMNGVFTQC